MTSLARQERAALADELDTAGPGAPTLCDGWDAYDLAAHLVARERRPDAAIGLVVRPLNGWTERVRRGVRAKHPFGELVEVFRSGPPKLSLAAIERLDQATNTGEFYIHGEDVRRAQPGWETRELPEELEKFLWASLKSTAKLALRSAPTGLTLVSPLGSSIVARAGEPMVQVSGPASELALYCAGRQAVAQVQITGDEAAVAALATASFGF